jgi:hypothetical protein
LLLKLTAELASRVPAWEDDWLLVMVTWLWEYPEVLSTYNLVLFSRDTHYQDFRSVLGRIAINGQVPPIFDSDLFVIHSGIDEDALR